MEKTTREKFDQLYYELKVEGRDYGARGSYKLNQLADELIDANVKETADVED